MLSGSAPATTTCSPSARRRCTSRSSSTASGSAYCSPDSPATKRPPSATPARLEPPQRPHHLAPGHLERLATPQLPGHDAPARQQLVGHRLGQLLVARREHAVVDRGRAEHLGPGQQRPAALADAGPHRARGGGPGGPTGAGPCGCASGRGPRAASARPRTRRPSRGRGRPGPTAPRPPRPGAGRSAGPARDGSRRRGRAARPGRRPPRRPRARARRRRRARRAASSRGRRARRRPAGWPATACRCGPGRSARGVSRPQTTSPERQSSSSQRGS